MSVSTAPATTGTTTWQIDPAHTQVGFTAKHMMFTTVRGHFRDVKGTIELDEANLADSKVEVEIDAASVNTNVEQRDGHLKSPDFLHVEEHPTITFRSTRVEPLGGDRARIAGELTIRGTTRPVTLDAELGGRAVNPYGKEVVGFEARTKINRKDFGLTFNIPLEGGGVVVSDELKIEIDVQAVRV